MIGTVVHPQLVASQGEPLQDYPSLQGCTAAAKAMSKFREGIFSVYVLKSSGNCTHWGVNSSWRAGQRLGEKPEHPNEFSRSRARAAGAK